MKILCHVAGYPGPTNDQPGHLAGAETTLRSILEWLVRRGHEVAVVAPSYAVRGNFQGVEVRVLPTYTTGRLIGHYQEADLILTHLNLTRIASKLARKAHKPCVHLVHNHRQLERHLVQPKDASLVVFNSDWLAGAVSWAGESMVVRPPVFADEYRTTPGDRVTLISLTQSKGAGVFWELAERMPKVQFLGVKGSYGEQRVPEHLPSNVEVLEMTPDVRNRVYARTKVLLVPSDYESWGRVAVEAMASGIPVVAHPTEGLKESLGGAGTFRDRDDLAGWEAAVEALVNNPTHWAERSRLSLGRSAELDPEADLIRLEAAMLELVK